MKKKCILLATLIVSMGMIFAQGTAESTNYSSSTEPPKYVFMFIGDGMASVQAHAAQVFNGKNTYGNVTIGQLAFTQFPVTGIQYTQDSTSFCPDSASTATSLSSGFKTHSGVIGMGVDKTTKGETIAEKLKTQLGWKIGIVSSVTINHATPAAYYAHVPNRNNYYDIGIQMATSGFDYFAGGAVNKAEDGGKESIYSILEQNGYQVTNDKDEILSLQNGGKVYAYGPRLQDSGSLPYALDTTPDDLTLADFVKKGIDVLDNDTGFFMMVEGGKIDWAGHANDAKANIYDVIALDDAVKVALEFAKSHPNETLILVTGDHETGGMTIGYATTGYNTAFSILENQKMSYVEFDSLFNSLKKNGSIKTLDDIMPIITEQFGLAADTSVAANENLVLTQYEYQKLQRAFAESMKDKPASDEEAMLLYGGYNPLSVTLTHLINNKAGIGWTSYAHTGVPVPVYAIGTGSERFSGSYDNTEIAKRLFSLTNVR